MTRKGHTLILAVCKAKVVALETGLSQPGPSMMFDMMEGKVSTGKIIHFWLVTPLEINILNPKKFVVWVDVYSFSKEACSGFILVFGVGKCCSKSSTIKIASTEAKYTFKLFDITRPTIPRSLLVASSSLRD